MVLLWIVTAIGVAGFAAGMLGVIGIVRDSRRMGTLVLALGGLAVGVFALGMLLYERGHPGLLLGAAILALAALVLGNLLGYPVLVVFLLWSGITVLRRETRTLGNALALLAGVALIVLPSTLRLLEPPGVVQEDPGYMIRYGIHLGAVLLVAYVACAFSAFLGAALIYRWRRKRIQPEAIIVLGAGLIRGKVPPLLAGRLERGLQAQRDDGGRPTIIASGGQGVDEPFPEGVAMREYLIGQGADPDRVVAETESSNTWENLRFSRRLLPEPESPVLVVTSSYHVFRTALLTRSLGMQAHVVGARTAWYFLPSAVLREFVGAMRDRWVFHLVAGCLIAGFAVLVTLVLVPAMVPPAQA